ncbi:VOC family protein [Alteribacter populi]|uniref:VOC family protein n=1 Tax=Alteribacter populi TaxID=2011011 RepID=UPI000BBB4BE5|nr:VOC family protein [Alteribacter populi]
MILSIYPYLITNGNGHEAIEFYEKALDAKVEGVQTFGELPENPGFTVPAEAKELILNAHLKVGNTDLMISDTMPGQPHQVGSHITIAVSVNDVEKSKEVFRKLLDGGTEVMPLQETFWSPSYGQVTDKYGVTWHVSTHLDG